jgi:hypothetical protein
MNFVSPEQFRFDSFNAVAGAVFDNRLNIVFNFFVPGGKPFLGFLAAFAGVFGNAEQLAGAVERNDFAFNQLPRIFNYGELRDA